MLHCKCSTGPDGFIASYSLAHNYNDNITMKKKKSNEESSERATQESRRRAFARGSDIIYLNRSKLTTFITLTYKKQHSDYNKVVQDLKNSFSRRHISYIAVVERHKSGCLHIHAITSDLENVVSLRRGKYSWKSWQRGFSDVKFLKDTDDKFRVEKYIFKYMNKSEKIGGRYFLKSNDLTLRKGITPEEYFTLVRRKLADVMECQLVERKIITLVDGRQLPYRKEYYAKANPHQT